MVQSGMAGTWLNVMAIVVGGVFGLLIRRPFSAANQSIIKLVLGACAIWFGLRLTWISIHGPLLQILKQIGIMVAALALGKLSGQLLHLQKASNRIGGFARDRMAVVQLDNPNRFSDGFNVCSLRFCAAPLGIIGSLTDGLSEYYSPLLVKAVMDGLASMSFAALFGLGSILSAVPVLVFQGTISVVATRSLAPFLQAHELLEPVNATAGLLVFCVGLLILEIKKIAVTDYLPALVYAPLLASWLR